MAMAIDHTDRTVVTQSPEATPVITRAPKESTR
jgi:hypothetical protein